MANIYFSIEELNPHNYPLTQDILVNLNDLIFKMSAIREALGRPMHVNSGLRSKEQQDSLVASGKSNAPTSKHLTGQACDIRSDNNGLQDWVKANVSLLETIGLWCEAFEATPTWVHFQSVPPKSGNRFFIP